MTVKQLKAAMAEARRFLDRGDALLKAQDREPIRVLAGADFALTDNPREQGAVRRASMDLTRSLADLRRRG
jgi:hypothetical protein